jgi:hypothetical protein
MKAESHFFELFSRRFSTSSTSSASVASSSCLFRNFFFRWQEDFMLGERDQSVGHSDIEAVIEKAEGGFVPGSYQLLH